MSSYRERGISRRCGGGSDCRLTGMPKTFCCSDMMTAVQKLSLEKKEVRGDGEMEEEERRSGRVERNKSASTGGGRYLGGGKKFAADLEERCF